MFIAPNDTRLTLKNNFSGHFHKCFHQSLNQESLVEETSLFENQHIWHLESL
jgi:hypothetical protein